MYSNKKSTSKILFSYLGDNILPFSAKLLIWRGWLKAPLPRCWVAGVGTWRGGVWWRHAPVVTGWGHWPVETLLSGPVTIAMAAARHHNTRPQHESWLLHILTVTPTPDQRRRAEQVNTISLLSRLVPIKVMNPASDLLAAVGCLPEGFGIFPQPRSIILVSNLD